MPDNINHNQNHQEPTGAEILSAVNNFATQTEQNFQAINRRFEGIDHRFEGIDQKFVSIDQRLDKIDQKINTIQATMVTKDYLDEKLADLRGDLVVLVRKEDNKLKTLLEIMTKKKLLSEQEAEIVLRKEPFPLFTP